MPKTIFGTGLLFCRALEEAGSFGSIAEYQRVRHIGAIYTDSGKSRAEVVAKFAEKAGYKEDGATATPTIARHNRSIVSLYRTEQDEDGEETGEDVTCDDSWDYADILWNGVRARAVKRAFLERVCGAKAAGGTERHLHGLRAGQPHVEAEIL